MKKIIWPLFRFILPASVTAVALWPFIFFKDNKHIENAQIENHERIHLRQQQELLLIFFYLIYFLEYIINLFKFQNHQQAYRAISFEKEAYTFDSNANYLMQRKMYAMWR